MQKRFKILIFFVLAVTFTQVHAQRVNLKLVMLDQNYLEQTKAKINQSEYQAAYTYLLKEADKTLKTDPYTVMDKKQTPPSGDKHDFMSLAPYHWPNPATTDGLPYIRKDGKKNPEVEDYQDKNYLPKLVDASSILALAWYYSGDEKYAKKAASFLRTWFIAPATKMNPNLNFAQAMKGHNTGRGAGIIDARFLFRILDAVRLLSTSKVWTSSDNEAFTKWISEFRNWMETSENGLDEINAPNNHGTFYDVQRLAYSIFLHDTVAAMKIVDNTVLRLDKQMNNDGAFPKELERTTSMHYSTFNLTAFFCVGLMAEKIGKPIWTVITPSGKSFQKGLDFIYPFYSGEKKWKSQQIKPFDNNEIAPVVQLATKKFKTPDFSGLQKKSNWSTKTKYWILLTEDIL